MNRRQGKRDACIIAARLLDNYLDVGQPYTGHGCEGECRECSRRVDAIEELRDELDRRGAYGVVEPDGSVRRRP